MTGGGVGGQRTDPVAVHRRRRRRKWSALAVAALAVLCVAGGLVWVYFSADNPRDAAQTIQVEIPSGATEIAAKGEGFEYKGNCADIEFLIPDSAWEEYVGRYFKADALRPRYGPFAACGGERTVCDEREYVPGQSGFVAVDHIADSGTAYTRSLAVVPGCKPGLTRISWRASR